MRLSFNHLQLAADAKMNQASVRDRLLAARERMALVPEDKPVLFRMLKDGSQREQDQAIAKLLILYSTEVSSEQS